MTEKMGVAGERFHALDQLRAIMITLVLVAHALCSFTVVDHGPAWPHKDPQTSIVFDLVLFYMHVFRLPLYFVLAGFFAHLLCDRRGLLAMAANRFRRIAIPFVVLLPPLWVATKAGFLYAGAGAGASGMESAGVYLESPALWFEGLNTIHLWFLYYLLLFSTLAVLCVAAARLVPGHHRWCRTLQVLRPPLGLEVWITATFIILLQMRSGWLATDLSFTVRPAVFLGYGIYYLFGWLLYADRRELAWFRDRAWTFLAVGTACCAAYLAIQFGLLPGLGRATLIIRPAFAAIGAWTMISGLIGAFLFLLNHPRKWGRYFSDASYWLYVSHLPVAIWTAGALQGLALPVGTKFAITLGVTIGVPLVSYHLLVRSTVLGVLLNGRRHPLVLVPAFARRTSSEVPHPSTDPESGTAALS